MKRISLLIFLFLFTLELNAQSCQVCNDYTTLPINNVQKIYPPSKFGEGCSNPTSLTRFVSTSSSEVRSLFEGKVSSIVTFEDSTMAAMIITKDTFYLASYYPLASCNLKKGNIVAIGQIIGTLAKTEYDDSWTLEFRCVRIDPNKPRNNPRVD